MVEVLLSGIVLGLVPVTILGLFVAAYLQYRRGNQIENGKMMFVYQAQEAFRLWTIAPNQWVGLLPSINKKVLQLLEND